MSDAPTPRTRHLSTACAVVAIAFGAATAHAHHSFAMYDQTKQETYTGKLVRFIPGANHAQLLFEIVDAEGQRQIGADGKPITWGVELGPAATIAKQGVTVESFPLGTVITVTLNPLRNGKTFGAMAQGARLIRCGTDVPPGGCTTETGEVFLASRN
jgi:hypothetical protein